MKVLPCIVLISLLQSCGTVGYKKVTEQFAIVRLLRLPHHGDSSGMVVANWLAQRRDSGRWFDTTWEVLGEVGRLELELDSSSRLIDIWWTLHSKDSTLLLTKFRTLDSLIESYHGPYLEGLAPLSKRKFWYVDDAITIYRLRLQGDSLVFRSDWYDTPRKPIPKNSE